MPFHHKRIGRRISRTVRVFGRKHREVNNILSININNINGNTVKCKMKFIDSVKFIASSQSGMLNNLAKGYHKGKYKDCKSSLKYVNIEDGFLVFKCS